MDWSQLHKGLLRGWRLLSLGSLMLVGCGGGTTGETVEVIKTPPPLQVNAELQPQVLALDNAASARWQPVIAANTDAAAPITRFDVPADLAVEVGKIYIREGIAYKVVSVDLDAAGSTRHVVVAAPAIQEIFTTLKLTGSLPLAPLEDSTQTGVSAASSQVGVFSAKFSAWNLKPVTDKDYDPSTAAELGSCIKISSAQGSFKDNGTVVTPLGYKASFKCATIKSDDGVASGGIDAEVGLYADVEFKEGFDLANPASYDGNYKQTFYSSASAGLSAGDKFKLLNKLYRLLSVKNQFTVMVPTPLGLPVPVIITTWIPLDVIVQANLSIKGGVGWKTETKYVFESGAITSTELTPFSFEPTVTGSAELSGAMFLRPGLGIGVYGLIPFSFHPKFGIKADYKVDLVKACAKRLVRAVAGADVVLLPSTWIQIGNDPYEKKKTKEIIAPVDIGKPLVDKSDGNGCNKPEAVMVSYDNLVRPPAVYRNVSDSTLKISNGGSLLGIKVSGSPSRFADDYLWELEGAFGQRRAVGTGESYSLNALDLASVPGGASRLHLTVSNGGLLKVLSTTSVQLVANAPPVASGVAAIENNQVVLRSTSGDTDGRVTQTEWALGGRSWRLAEGSNELQLPLADFIAAAGSGGTATLSLTVWDDAGAATTTQVVTPPLQTQSAIGALRGTLAINWADGNSGFSNGYGLNNPLLADLETAHSMLVLVSHASGSPAAGAPPTGTVQVSYLGVSCTGSLVMFPTKAGATQNSSVAGYYCPLAVPTTASRQALVDFQYSGDARYPGLHWSTTMDMRVWGSRAFVSSTEALPGGARQQQITPNPSAPFALEPSATVRIRSANCADLDRIIDTVTLSSANTGVVTWTPANGVINPASYIELVSDAANYYAGPQRTNRDSGPGQRACRP